LAWWDLLFVATCAVRRRKVRSSRRRKEAGTFECGMRSAERKLARLVPSAATELINRPAVRCGEWDTGE
jgi:hypothetical protein